MILLPLLLILIPPNIIARKSSGYGFAKITSKSCCVTDGKFDLIGGLQKSSVTHDECREFCSTYDWCHGIRITYEGVHDEQCRLLTPGADIKMSGWTHFNKNNWKEASEWKDCNGAYGGYNCYKKYAPDNVNTMEDEYEDPDNIETLEEYDEEIDYTTKPTEIPRFSYRNIIINPTLRPMKLTSLKPKKEIDSDQCTPKDSYACLKNSPRYNWSNYDCASYTNNCETYAKDFKRCCPISCGSENFTKEECNKSSGKGSCVYPNEAQCPGKEIKEEAKDRHLQNRGKEHMVYDTSKEDDRTDENSDEEETETKMSQETKKKSDKESHYDYYSSSDLEEDLEPSESESESTEIQSNGIPHRKSTKEIKIYFHPSIIIVE